MIIIILFVITKKNILNGKYEKYENDKQVLLCNYKNNKLNGELIECYHNCINIFEYCMFRHILNNHKTLYKISNYHKDKLLKTQVYTNETKNNLIVSINNINKKQINKCFNITIDEKINDEQLRKSICDYQRNLINHNFHKIENNNNERYYRDNEIIKYKINNYVVKFYKKNNKPEFLVYDKKNLIFKNTGDGYNNIWNIHFERDSYYNRFANKLFSKNLIKILNKYDLIQVLINIFFVVILISILYPNNKFKDAEKKLLITLMLTTIILGLFTLNINSYKIHY